MSDAFLFNHSKSKVKVPTKILGVKINSTPYTSSASYDSDPNTVEYIDGLEGCSPASWSTPNNYSSYSPATISHDQEIFRRIREVCNFRYCHISTTANTGSFNPKYLRDDDWTKYENGTDATANMTNGMYNTLTEFPHFYLSVTKDSTGSMYVRISNHKVDDTYSDWMFSYKGMVYSAKYLGCFLGSVRNNALCSIANTFPATESAYNMTVHARNNYRGELLNYGSWVILQVLYLLAFCRLNSQHAVSFGYISGGDGINLTSAAYTGENFSLAVGGMYRTASLYRASRFRLFGVEDAWGNQLQYCLNLKIIYDGGYALSLSDYTLPGGSYKDTSSNTDYTLGTIPISTHSLQFVQNFAGTTLFPFTPVPRSGSSMIFTGDTQNYSPEYGMICVGGYYGSAKDCGLFRNTSSCDWYGSGSDKFGSRLVLIHPEPYVA